MNKITISHRNYTSYTLYRRGSYYHADCDAGCRKYRAINAPRQWWNVTANGQRQFKDADTIDTLEEGVRLLNAQHPNGHGPQVDRGTVRRVIRAVERRGTHKAREWKGAEKP